MMFSLSFILVILIAFGANGQTNDLNTFRPNNPEKGYPFGKLRVSEDGKNEELIPSNEIEKSQLNQDPSTGVHPLPSPCVGSRPSTKIVYPKDRTKYIQCRDEYHYEIFTCSNGGEYNEQADSCDLVVPMVNKCEEEKPCLNDGQCTLLSNSSFKCTCRKDWTGERCETPLTSCVKKPCGPNAECRTLKTVDYEQDYVCICHGRKGYGLNCQEIVPNPCLTSTEQFFPYAFSQRSYIQCDGELIHFQPCAPTLYWSQEEKICDRKPPAKSELPMLLKKLVSQNNNDVQPEQTEMNIKEETTVTTTAQTEQQNSFGTRAKEDNEAVFAFVPARVANRQQLQSNMNNQQGGASTQKLREKEQNIQELTNQLSQSVDSNQIRQEFMSKPKQWPTKQIETNIRQPLTIQSGRNQPRLQNSQQQWVPTSTEPSFIDANMGESQTGLDQQQQQQNFQQQNQAFGTPKWLNQLPDVKIQSNQRFVAQPQSWQGSQTIQNQPQFQNQNQQMSVETAIQNAMPFEGFQSQNTRDQDQTWKTRPITQSLGIQSSKSIGFNTQNFGLQPQQGSQTMQNQPRFQDQNQQTFSEPIISTAPQNTISSQEQTWDNKPTTQLTGNQLPQSTDSNTQSFLLQPQTWQTSQTFQNQQPLTSNIPERISVDNKNRLNTGMQQNNQQSWQNKGLNRQSVIQPETSSTDVQRGTFNNEPTLTGQSVQDQQQTQTLNLESSADSNNDQSKRGMKQDNQQQAFGNQQWLSNQVPDVKIQSNQRFVAQPQSWQGSQTIQNQPQFQNQNRQMFFETAAGNVMPFQGFQSQNNREQDQTWQNKQPTQQTQLKSTIDQPIKSQSNQIFAFKPTQRSDSSKQNQQPLIVDGSSQIQNTQFGLNQQQKGLPSQTSFEQKQPWSTNQQLQNSDDLKIQSARPIVSSQTQPWSQTGQSTGNSFETAAIANKPVLQGFSAQNLPGRQPIRTVDQRQQDNNPLGQQTTTEQRKTLDSIPTVFSGSWPSRS